MILWILLAAAIVVLLLLFVFSDVIAPKPLMLDGAHVLVTGGSSGIGKCLAIEAVKRGANVTLLARNKKRLEEAQAEVEKHIPEGSSQKVLCVSVDVSKDFGELDKIIQQIGEQQGPVRALINCAGTSISGRFLETPVEDYKRLMDTNFLGGVLLTRAVIPSMMREKQGRVVFVSSMAGQMGLFGYTAYSPSKFALRGFAESLQMEMKPYNIHITLAFPPDTDTPGFAEEQKSKPRETALISESGGLLQPETVAFKILDDTVKGRFISSVGMDGYILSIATAGFAPVTSVMEAVQQVFLMGLIRVVCLSYLTYFNSIVKKCHSESAAPENCDKKYS